MSDNRVFPERVVVSCPNWQKWIPLGQFSMFACITLRPSSIPSCLTGRSPSKWVIIGDFLNDWSYHFLSGKNGFLVVDLVYFDILHFVLAQLLPGVTGDSPSKWVIIGSFMEDFSRKEYSYALKNSSIRFLDPLLVYLNFFFRDLGTKTKKFS